MAEASPKPINYWTFGTGEMIVANEKFITEVVENSFCQTLQNYNDPLLLKEKPLNSYKFQLTLTIKRLQPEDFGTYRCISKNSIGQAEEVVELYGKLHDCLCLELCSLSVMDELTKHWNINIYLRQSSRQRRSITRLRRSTQRSCRSRSRLREFLTQTRSRQ